MSEDPRERAEKYVQLLESILPEVEFQTSNQKDQERLALAKNSVHSYLKDAKYYLEQNKAATALAAVAYAEGIIDCLGMLGIAKIPGGKFFQS